MVKMQSAAILERSVFLDRSRYELAVRAWVYAMTSDAVSVKKETFEALAMPLTNILVAAAYRLCGNMATAEDLVQEAYVTAWQKFNQYKPGTNFKAWVFRILILLHRNQSRVAAKAPSSVENIDFAASSVESAPIAATLEGWNSIHADLVEDEFKKALDQLDADHRMVLMLVSLGGLSYQECADAVNVPLGTVMSRLYRARKQLHGELSEYAREKGFLKRSPVGEPIP